MSKQRQLAAGPMRQLRIDLALSKCQGFGKCAATAPDYFRVDDGGKVRLAAAGETTDDTVVRAAKSCPYRVITIVDAESNEQIFPVRRR